MNLKTLNKTALHQRLKSMVARERELLHEILRTIKEIDLRRTYLDFGFPNLFSYLTEDLGYSAGSAQRRIEAVRLMKELPNLGSQIESGEVKLTQISLVQKAAREVEKRISSKPPFTRGAYDQIASACAASTQSASTPISSNDKFKVTASDKAAILQQIVNKNFKDSQQEVADFFDLPVQVQNKETVQADRSVRVELTLSYVLHEKIKKAQGLLAHAVPTNDLVAYLEYLTNKIIKEKTHSRTTTKSTQSNKYDKDSLSTFDLKVNTISIVEPDFSNNNNNLDSEPQRFSVRTKKETLNQQVCCQYHDPHTQKICGSVWFLQVDHKHSLWAGGSSEVNNAQILCAQHNQLKYLTETGRRHA